MSSRPLGVRTWIELDRAAIAHNYNTLRSMIGSKTQFMAVIKSNAYGHGLLDFGMEIDKLGPDFIGVDSIVEATALRAAGITRPLFVLGFTLPEMLAVAAEKDISLAISSFEGLVAIATESARTPFAAPLKIHVKVDTGMHRQGFQEPDMDRVIEELAQLSREKKIIVEGLFTHFGAAKNPSFRTRTESQLRQFEVWRTALLAAGFKPIAHTAASGGTIVFPESHFDMVRCGVALYGVWPSIETRHYRSYEKPLKPVMTWKTVVGEVKHVPKGECFGYDFTETCNEDKKIVIIPIGYWHGFPRALSSIGSVIIRGKKARVLGRVSMDMLIVDVTHIPRVEVLDEVVIVGCQKGEFGEAEITVDEMADAAGVSSYELITRINPLIKKIVV